MQEPVRGNGSRFGRWKWSGDYLLAIVNASQVKLDGCEWVPQRIPHFSVWLPVLSGWDAAVAPATATLWPLELSNGDALKVYGPFVAPVIPLLQSLLQFYRHYFSVLDPFLLQIPGVFFCIKLMYTIYHLHFIGEANNEVKYQSDQRSLNIEWKSWVWTLVYQNLRP